MAARELGNPLGNPLAVPRRQVGGGLRLGTVFSATATPTVVLNFDGPRDLRTLLMTAISSPTSPSAVNAELRNFLLYDTTTINHIPQPGGYTSYPGLQVTVSENSLTVNQINASAKVSVSVVEVLNKIKNAGFVDVSYGTTEADYGLPFEINDPTLTFFSIASGVGSTQGSLSTCGVVNHFSNQATFNVAFNPGSIVLIPFGFVNPKTLRRFSGAPLGYSGSQRLRIVEFDK